MQYKAKYKLLTFYKFVNITNPEEEVKKHLQFTNDIGMKGRVYIGEEGISATMSCTMGQYQAYMNFLNSSPYFNDINDIEDKWSDVKGHQFDKMIVKYRKEIVALDHVVKAEEVQEHYQAVTPEEFKKIVDEGDDKYAILDMRNTYEYKLGHFKGAEPAGTINFRDVDDMFDHYKKKYKDKKVVMYCTGGIRCEKLNVLLQKKGVDNFYALDGGVVTYTNKYGDGNRLGSLYTFDGVVSTKVNPADKHTTIGKCIYTGYSTDHTENCRYSPCNARIIARRKEFKKHAGLCSQECYDKAKKDGRLKPDFSFDSMDYKALRQKVKEGKLTHDDFVSQVSKHLETMIGETKFNHEHSQKEDIVDQVLIQSCMV